MKMKSRTNKADYLFLEGAKALKRGDLESAELAFAECIQLFPNRESTRHYLAVVYTMKADHLSDLCRFDEALNGYLKALEYDPRYPVAWSNRGTILCDYFNLVDESISCFETALSLINADTGLNPSVVHANLGRAHAKNSNHATAIEHYKHALSHDPKLVAALVNCGVLYNHLRQYEEALHCFEEALELQRNIPEAWINRGHALTGLRRFEEALDSYSQALELKPDYAEIWLDRGNVLRELKRYPEVLASYERALDIRPDCVAAWINRSNALRDLARYDEALASCDRAIELQSNYAEAWINRGNALMSLMRHEDALSNFEKAIEIRPEYAEAWSNRGNTLRELARYDEALTSCSRAIELLPNYAEAWSNRGTILSELKRYEQALVSFKRASQLKPDYAEAIYNTGLLELAHKNFMDGFQNYLMRWRSENFPSDYLQTMLPYVRSATSAKNVLLWAEQGLGDEIFFAGMLNLASQNFVSIGLVADRRLHPIFARSFPNIELFDRDGSGPANSDCRFDAHAPVGDLGHLLLLDEGQIRASRKSFLKADPTKKAGFQLTEPFNGNKIICGIAWESLNRNFGKEKTIHLEELKPILKDSRLEFINLQYGKVDAELRAIRSGLGVNVHEINNLDIYNDIDGLLALIDACDIVITTSNITAHLAGSIGKKGCVLVPFSRGKIWYWHLNDDFSLWYPSLKIFHQEDRYDWSRTIKKVHSWLEQTL